LKNDIEPGGVIVPATRRVSARSIHEAGHAIVAMALRHPVDTVTIRGTGHIGGSTMINFRSTRRVRAYEEMPDGRFRNVARERIQKSERQRARDDIVVCLGGAEAERQIVSDLQIPDGDKWDRKRIKALLIDAVESGQSDQTLLKRLQRRAAQLVQRHRAAIIELAAFLVANETLAAPTVQAIWRRMRGVR
jgi:ATP-dependent Zn protease